jgi:hypothetical protein
VARRTPGRDMAGQGPPGALREMGTHPPPTLSWHSSFGSLRTQRTCYWECVDGDRELWDPRSRSHPRGLNV